MCEVVRQPEHAECLGEDHPGRPGTNWMGPTWMLKGFGNRSQPETETVLKKPYR
jgi:hypothetical protein